MCAVTTAQLRCVAFDANDPSRLARFWAAALTWDTYDEIDEEIGLVPTDGTLFNLLFLPVPDPKIAKNRIHLDLVSESPEHQSEVVDRLITLGASPVDIGQPETADHVVLADPEGNEFCIVLRGEFLATTGFLGAVVFEPGNPAAGYFWSDAIGWPLVYDKDGDTAIRSPRGGGPFITFGPPGRAADTAKNRLHLEIASPPDGDRDAEVERLLRLGATRVDIGQGVVPWVVMADPDGNEFRVLTPG